MRLLDRLRFRWINNRDPLPGEVEPTERGAVIVWMSKVPDAEPSPFLRKLRGLVTGYGEGWTFTAAMWDLLWPWLLIIGLWIASVSSYLFLRSR